MGQTAWRTAYRAIVKEAGLSGLRFHDLRHHAITELSEGQTSDMTIMSIAGHVSKKMLEHYSHVRMDAKRKAVEALASSRKGPRAAASEGVHVTNHVTKAEVAVGPVTEVTENIGGPERKEFELKGHFPLRLFWLTPHPLRSINALPRKRFISTSSDSDPEPLRED